MMCVYCHFSEIHAWIKRVLNTHRRYGYGGPKKLIGANSMYSQCPPQGHHDTLAQSKKEIEFNTFGRAGLGLQESVKF